MDNVSIYIKKLIALMLSAFIMFLLSSTVSWYLALSFGFLVLSFLHYKITGEKPAYLFGMPESDTYLREKGGFWLLFRWILMLFGFFYDLIVWTINGAYVLFLIFIDILLLVKTVLFWIVHAVIWFLALFVPPLVFIYKMVIHYLIFWPWWIYRLSFRNIRLSVNSNFYRITIRGAVLAIFLLLLFYGASVLTGAPVIVAFGVVFSFLPVIWAFGEISSMRHGNRWNADFDDVKMRFGSGFDALRAVLFYLTIMLAGILIEMGMNMLGWIPNAGFSLLGLSINVNTFITLVLLFIFVILLFASLMIPPYVVYEKGHANSISDSAKFLGIIGKKFLRYILSLIPASFFSAVLAVIPAIIVVLAVYITLNVKNLIIDSRINTLNHSAMTLQGPEKFEVEKRAERLGYYKEFPQNVFVDFTNIKELNRQKKSLELNYAKGRKDLEKMEDMFIHDVDSLKTGIEQQGNDSLRAPYVEQMKTTLERKQADFSKWKSGRTNDLAKMQVTIRDIKSKVVQLPIAFLFSIMWFALFGGLILAVILSYLGNVFYALYGQRDDDKPVYWSRVVAEMKAKDHNQPLLGFTLLLVVVAILVLLLIGGVTFPATIF